MPLQKGSRHVPGVLIIGEKSEPGAGPSMLSAFALRSKLPGLNVSVVEVPESRLDSVQDLLIKSGQFRYVEKDYYANALDFTPNDPQLKNQWHLSTIHAQEAWGSTLGSQKVIIGIIDSGIDATHEDLSSKIIAGKDFLSPNSTTNDTSDDHGHGTAVAGAAAAATANGKGIAGVCPFCQLMPLRVFGKDGSGSYSNIAAGDHLCRRSRR